MWGRTGHRAANLVHKIMMINPLAVFYLNGFSRKVLFRVIYFFTACHLIGLVRRPYINRQIFRKAESEKQLQEEEASNILSKIDIKLSDYSENYFIILSVFSSPQKQQERESKQRILFELNNLINSRLQINQNYFGDIKFLFIGDKKIYDLLQTNSTIIEFYEKEKERSNDTTIFIMTKDEDGNEKLINSLGYKADLNSIIRIISKHKARKFATSLQF